MLVTVKQKFKRAQEVEHLYSMSDYNIYLLRDKIQRRELTDQKEALIRLKYLSAWLIGIGIRYPLDGLGNVRAGYVRMAHDSAHRQLTWLHRIVGKME